MINKAANFAVLLCLLVAVSASGQDSTYNFTFQTLGGYSTPGVVPFWLRSNQFGSTPLDGASLSFIGAARKDFDLSKDKLFDWGASLEGRANLGNGSNLTLIEGYGKVRLGIFELRAGRSKKITGLCDTTLSSGSWAISGTNLGIPEVELSVRDYWTLPILGDLFAIKGNFAHGWMGAVDMMAGFEVDTIRLDSYLHQKSLYLQLSIPNWKSKLYAGLNHQVVWCKGNEYYNSDFKLSHASEYLYIISGKRYNSGSIAAERLGNHLGSVDIGLEHEFTNIRIFLYRQFLYEAGSLAHLANIQDGLTGLTIANRKDCGEAGRWNKFLVEVLYTRNQAGRPWSPDTPSPYEPYYNHGQYINGWSYKGTGIGSPFVTPRTFLRAELPSYPWEHFVNNRLLVLHFGFEGSFNSYSCNIKTSWSRNYGTYRTSDEEQSTGIPFPGSAGIFGVRDQLSTFVDLNRKAGDRLTVGISGAFDFGELYYNSGGILITTFYSFN